MPLVFFGQTIGNLSTNADSARDNGLLAPSAITGMMGVQDGLFKGPVFAVARVASYHIDSPGITEDSDSFMQPGVDRAFPLF